MSVATWLKSVFTSQTATNYKSNIDACFAVAERIVDNFAPRQTTTPAMTVTLDAGALYNGQTLTEVAAQTTGTITAPATNPRIDRIVIDKTSGAISVITGTPAGSPVAPALTAGVFPVAQVLLQTSSVTIVNSMITDERTAALTAIAAQITAAPDRPTPAGTDVLGVVVGGLLNKLTLTNLAAYLNSILSSAPISRGLNKFANSCCMVAQRINLTVNLTTARLVGQVDACAFWCSTGAVSAGTLTQLATGALAGGTGYAARAAGVTLTGGGVLSFAVRMEARDAKKFKNQTCSFHVSVDHDVGSNVNYTIIAKKVTTTDDVFSALTTISTSSATAVVTATGTDLLFNAIAMGDCSHGIEFEVQAACGNVTTKNFNFTEWALDIGSVAPTFNGNPYEVDLAMCQRYLPTFNSSSTTSLIGAAYCTATTAGVGLFSYPVQTRITPTGILSSVATQFNINTFNASVISFSSSSNNEGAVLLIISGAAAGLAGALYAVNASAYLLFTGAELF